MDRTRLITCCISSLALTLSAGPAALAQTVGANPLQLAPHHATISVANMDAESLWYQRVLRFTESSRNERGHGRLVCHLTIPGYRIDLLSQPGSARHQQASNGLEQGWLNIVFQTPSQRTNT
jgi:hypothetical protein